MGSPSYSQLSKLCIPHINPFTFSTYDKGLGASGAHPLGTTSQGQDVFWLLIEAIHNSLAIGLIVAAIGTVVDVHFYNVVEDGRAG